MKTIRLKKTRSTNDAAWKEALDGAPDGTCVIAAEQTAGRGRFGRSWHSPPGTGMYLSYLLRRPVPLKRVPLVTALGAIAVVEAVEDSTGLDAKIRFPNDVLIGRKKVAGVLVESRFVSSRPDLFVIGVGLNVNQDSFPSELEAVATSLRIEKGRELGMRRVERALLGALRRWSGMLDGPLKPFRSFWKRHSAMLGRPVRVREKGKDFRGTATEVDPVDGIVIRLGSGHLRGFRPETVELVEILPAAGN